VCPFVSYSSPENNILSDNTLHDYVTHLCTWKYLYSLIWCKWYQLLIMYKSIYSITSCTQCLTSVSCYIITQATYTMCTLITKTIFNNINTCTSKFASNKQLVILHAQYDKKAYQQGLYGPKIVWMFPGWYEEYWWRNYLEEIPCTREEMDQAAEGHISTGFFYLNPNSVNMISNMTVQEFESEYRNIEGYDKIDKTYEFIASKCYDVIWASSLALDCADKQLKQE
ncbi:hypothetical protein ACJMK2_024008, partial [Sinanodonta woodiana]